MKKALIVGGGAAGLSAGIYAAKNGLHATIAERLPTAGGCLSAWDRSGYHIDNCVNKVFRKEHIDKLESVYLFVCLLICTVDTIA